MHVVCQIALRQRKHHQTNSITLGIAAEKCYNMVYGKLSERIDLVFGVLVIATMACSDRLNRDVILQAEFLSAAAAWTPPVVPRPSQKSFHSSGKGSVSFSLRGSLQDPFSEACGQ